jgi:hypothetical protein
MLLRRRRPFLRVAAVGGAGYALGRRLGGAQDPDLHDSAAPTASVPIDDLRQLSELRKEGVLTDTEFDTQMAKLLQDA